MRVLRFLFSRLFLCLFIIAVLCAAIITLCICIHSLLPIAAAICLAYLLSLCAAVDMLCSEGAVAFKCAWLAIIIAVPIIGAVLCFISHSFYKPDCRGEPLPPSYCTRYEFFNDGKLFLNRLTGLISTAQKSVYLEFYIIAKGQVWDKIYKNLTLALERGVEVKIIYDGLGSALRAPKKQLNELIKKGALVKTFNKPLPVPLYRLNIRDHRKIAVVDGEAAFIGGVNIADEYAHITRPHAYWKDGGVLLYGEIATVLTKLFLSLFSNEDIKVDSPVKPQGDCFEITPVADAPDRGNAVFEDAVAAAIYAAEKRIYIFTPYLCAGEKLCDALAYSAAKGVDVSVIIPAVPDKKLPYRISKIYADKLQQRGIGVYEYTPGFMHFKGAVFDDGAYIGSHNFDFRSTRLNYEIGVICKGRLADDLADDFIAALELSKRLPLKKSNALTRLIDCVFCLFAPLV